MIIIAPITLGIISKIVATTAFAGSETAAISSWSSAEVITTRIMIPYTTLATILDTAVFSDVLIPAFS